MQRAVKFIRGWCSMVSQNSQGTSPGPGSADGSRNNYRDEVYLLSMMMLFIDIMVSLIKFRVLIWNSSDQLSCACPSPCNQTGNELWDKRNLFLFLGKFIIDGLWYVCHQYNLAMEQGRSVTTLKLLMGFI
jgi:hypothetical protein